MDQFLGHSSDASSIHTIRIVQFGRNPVSVRHTNTPKKCLQVALALGLAIAVLQWHAHIARQAWSVTICFVRGLLRRRPMLTISEKSSIKVAFSTYAVAALRSLAAYARLPRDRLHIVANTHGEGLLMPSKITQISSNACAWCAAKLEAFQHRMCWVALGLGTRKLNVE